MFFSVPANGVFQMILQAIFRPEFLEEEVLTHHAGVKLPLTCTAVRELG
jgi:hypothetical protein